MATLNPAPISRLRRPPITAVMASGPDSPASVSSRFLLVVSGLGLSGSSGLGHSSTGADGAPQVLAPGTVAVAAAPWRKLGLSRKALHKLVAAGGSRQPSPAYSSNRREIPIDLVRLCFKCFHEGHRRADCKFKPLCIRCALEGHISSDCRRPRSPRSEEELSHEAVAKVARTSSSSVPAGLAHRLSPVTRQVSPWEGPSPVPVNIVLVRSG
ncbi:hypothetical protein D1007_27866 [Hordeum vulgare]|nr:hypothetical protein D1007_27866 [Hordeum vulgare]